MEALRRYLIHLPLSLGYTDDKKVKINVYKALYYAVTLEGLYLDELFTGIPKDEVVALKDYSWPPKIVRSRPFFKYVAQVDYTHLPGQICGRLLNKGEPVYRCADCGYDSTCVLCKFCFNKEDHADHNVSVYFAALDGGGMCDCGDDTAFTRPLNCACQGEAGETVGLDEDFSKVLRETLTVVFDYILDVTNFSINTLPFIHRNINGRGGLKITSKNLSDLSSLPRDVYHAEDVNSDKIWYLVLWNDETHDYLEAETGIRAASGVNEMRANEIAKEVNSNGRAILKVAESYTDLLKAQKLAEVDGLVATIMTARDYMREVVIMHMFLWLHDITTYSGNSAFRDESKRLLAELLLEPGYQFSKTLPAEVFKCDSVDVKRACFENGLLYGGEFVNLALTKLQPGISASALMKPVREILHPDVSTQLAKSRLQYLLTYEIRFVSAVRKIFKDTIIPTLVADSNTKATFCEQYIDIYPMLLSVIAFSDREEALSSITDISVQLFTCPRTNMWVVLSGKLGNILGPLATLIEEHSSKLSQDSGYHNIIEIIVDVRSKREKSSILMAITEGIIDVGRIVEKNDHPDLMNVLSLFDNISFLLILQKYFQGSTSIVRKYGDHVERDLMNNLHIFLEKSLPILTLARDATEVQDVDTKIVTRGITSVVQFLLMRQIRMNAPGVAEFRVSREPVSFINPINSFLSYLIEGTGVEALQPIIARERQPFMKISDFSLRSIVLAAQVKVGFWIRNGVSVSRQATLYTESFTGELTYFRDFHLNQVAAILDDNKATFYNFLDRWELLSWYVGDVEYSKTIYEERFAFICEQFIIFLYNLFTDRSHFGIDTSRQGKEHRIRQSICYALCDEPRSYSSLKLELGQGMKELPELDELLDEVSNYQTPTGLTDFGVYRLKPHLFEKLDPLNLHLDSSRFQTISESLIVNIAKVKKIKESDVILTPDIQQAESAFVNERIGGITKTKEFAKLVYKLLQTALDSGEETFLPQLLHLIHAVLLDDEILHGEDYLNESFVTIPISDLLLTVVESKMSKHVVLKADYLLDQFVLKDKRIVESLIDCFGEEHVQTYKKRKIGLFETDSDKQKRLAEERKAKVMRKFAKQREKFIAQNEMEDEIQGDDSAEESHDTELRRCVACGETEKDELFGILLCTTASSIFWKVPMMNEKFTQLAFGDLDARLAPAPGKVYPEGYPYEEVSKEPSPQLEAFVASSCAHGMHYTCYKRSQNHAKHFPCPLCHNLHDAFLPSFNTPTHGPFVAMHLLRSKPKLEKYNQIIYSCGVEKSEALVETMIHGFTAEGEILEEMMKNIATDFTPSLKAKKDIDVFLGELNALSFLIADTIRSSEIATRLNGRGSLSMFLEDIPASTKTLIRSLMQCRVLLYKNRLLRYVTSSLDDMSTKFTKFWRTPLGVDGAFNEMVALFFQTNESLETLIRMAFAKLIAVNTYGISQSIFNGTACQKLELFNREMDPEAKQLFKRFVLDIVDDGEQFFSRLMDNYPNAVDDIYFCLERSMLPFLRQCIILWDILTSTRVDVNAYDSDDLFTSVKSKIEAQSRLDSADALCDILGIPTIHKFFERVFSDDQDSEFERGILHVVLRAKIPSQIETGILNIQYPGVIRLIDLPRDYLECITDPIYKVGGFKFDSVCLQCGKYMRPSEHLSHMSECSYMPIYFCPNSNDLNMVIHIAGNPIEVKIPAPYLTAHGEVKRGRVPGNAFLNQLRYDYFNKLWLNQGLFGFVTRSLFGMRDYAGAAANPPPGFENSDDEFDDEFGEWEED